MSTNAGQDEAAIQWFWQIIESAARSTERLRSALSALDKDRIYRFQDIFLDLATELQDEPFSMYVDADQSEDGLEDISHWVVSQGRAWYEAVLADPSRMPPRVDVDDSSDLFSVAYEVYYERFGEPLSLI